MPTKPHFRRINGYWQCAGQDLTGYGVTADGAYSQWLAISNFEEKEPMSGIDFELLSALMCWEPEVAH